MFGLSLLNPSTNYGVWHMYEYVYTVKEDRRNEGKKKEKKKRKTGRKIRWRKEAREMDNGGK